MKLKRVLTTMALVGVMGTNASIVFANTTPVVQTVEQKASVVASTSQLRYSDFLIDGEVWVDLDLQGATFRTDVTANDIRDAISTNYEVSTTLAVRRDRSGIEFGIYESLPNISYKDEWVITIDKSVLTVDYDLTTSIKVRDNVSAMPKVVSSVSSLTREELTKGVSITLKIEGANFNTACMGQYIRGSIMSTSNMAIYAVPFCDYTQNEITMYMRAMNGVSIHENKLTFELNQSATNAYNSLPVTIYLK